MVISFSLSRIPSRVHFVQSRFARTQKLEVPLGVSKNAKATPEARDPYFPFPELPKENRPIDLERIVKQSSGTIEDITTIDEWLFSTPLYRYLVEEKKWGMDWCTDQPFGNDVLRIEDLFFYKNVILRDRFGYYRLNCDFDVTMRLNKARNYITFQVVQGDLPSPHAHKSRIHNRQTIALLRSHNGLTA